MSSWWPWDRSIRASDHDHDKNDNNNNNSNNKASGRWTTPQLVLVSLTGIAASLGGVRVYKANVRRIPSIEHLKPDQYRKKQLYGYVTSVGDGDNFRFYHTPGGRMLGFGWLRRIPKQSERKALQGQTLHIRIAGVDAPELAHFGRPAQPYGQDALDWLKGQILGRYVRVLPYRRDQYDRAVASVYMRKWFGLRRVDLGLEMIDSGLATVYEAKFGSEFGNKEDEYRRAEQRARDRRIGMWQKPSVIEKILGAGGGSFESPRQYKDRMAKQERAQGEVK